MMKVTIYGKAGTKGCPPDRDIWLNKGQHGE